jgi:hypothetical protein
LIARPETHKPAQSNTTRNNTTIFITIWHTSQSNPTPQSITSHKQNSIGLIHKPIQIPKQPVQYNNGSHQKPFIKPQTQTILNNKPKSIHSQNHPYQKSNPNRHMKATQIQTVTHAQKGAEGTKDSDPAQQHNSRVTPQQN